MTQGIYATFMPKPVFGQNGSGMHTHQSLFKEGKNAFFDPDDKYHLSPIGKSYIFRCPDPACNPYLAFSVMLAAGLKGIEKGYELPEPVEEDFFCKSVRTR